MRAPTSCLSAACTACASGDGAASIFSTASIFSSVSLLASSASCFLCVTQNSRESSIACLMMASCFEASAGAARRQRLVGRLQRRPDLLHRLVEFVLGRDLGLRDASAPAHTTMSAATHDLKCKLASNRTYLRGKRTSAFLIILFGVAIELHRSVQKPAVFGESKAPDGIRGGTRGSGSGLGARDSGLGPVIADLRSPESRAPSSDSSGSAILPSEIQGAEPAGGAGTGFRSPQRLWPTVRGGGCSAGQGLAGPTAVPPCKMRQLRSNGG